MKHQDLYQRIKTYFRQAPARDVYHARPSQIAAANDAPTRATLETLVDAMFAGDVVLHWELECPVCKGFMDITNPFQTPLHEATCPACHTHFTIHTDAETQVTFSPHPALRHLEDSPADQAYRHELHTRFPPTTVYELMTVQTFRDWAQNEPLPHGEYLEVRKMVLWFSDLTGSTALYARNGDPLAFNLVSEHFAIVTDAILNAGGAVVKTIGDGVMATFTGATQGLQAAIDANTRLEAFNNEHQLRDDRRLHLKIGIHAGPAIVVTLNERLDYFGTTVNIAARVSNLAKEQEILLTQAVYTEPGIAAMEKPYRRDSFISPIRGLENSVALHRLRLNPQPQRKSLWDILGQLTKK